MVGALAVGGSRAEAEEPVPGVTPILQRISQAASGEAGNDFSGYPDQSDDGRWGAFTSKANNLVAGDINNVHDIFLADRDSGEIRMVSQLAAGTPGDANSWDPSISGDGRWIVFSSLASNLVPGDTNGVRDIFLFDRVGGTLARVSVSPTGAQVTRESETPRISGNGAWIVYASRDADHVPPGRQSGLRA